MKFQKVSSFLDSAHLEMGVTALNWWVWMIKVGVVAKIFVHILSSTPQRKFLGSSGTKNGTVKIFNHRRYLKPKTQDSMRKFRVPFMPVDPIPGYASAQSKEY